MLRSVVKKIAIGAALVLAKRVAGRLTGMLASRLRRSAAPRK